MAVDTSAWVPAICVVGFHHARGPEVETWFGVPEGTDPATENEWNFLPFMALSDGAHALEEDFSYFTLRRKATDAHQATSLFGMACTRQLDAKELINRPDDVTRSTVQKSIVIVAKSPHVFTAWREKLSLVTRAWFMQKDFTKTTILKDFQENLTETELNTSAEARESYVGISLREFIYEFKHQALVMFKCCLLQPKMLFFSSKCERLCMIQFALVSLIPGLITALEDCADPELDTYASNVRKADSLKTNDRLSLLAYVGLPIQIFGKGSLFGPYTPLQQLDVLADFGTKSYIVGSTNSLLLQQKDRYSDIIINLDESTVSCTSTSLRMALGLTAADRRWIDLIYNDIAADWDPEHPSRPRNLGFKGSEEYIRILFEQYIITLLSAVRFHLHFNSLPADQRTMSSFPLYENDPSLDFGEAWIDAWKKTHAFEIWSGLTDENLFNMVDPRHPTAGGFSVDDFNRRLAHELQELHLDERFATSKEALSKSLASGQKKVSTAINNIWADIEARRAARAKSPSRPNEEGSGAAAATAAGAGAGVEKPVPDPTSASNLAVPIVTTPSGSNSGDGGSGAGTPNKAGATTTTTTASGVFDATALRARAPDMAAAQAALGTAGQKASAYFSSWGSWASEKKKNWAKAREEEPPPPPPQMGQSDSVTRGAQAFEAMLGGSNSSSRKENTKPTFVATNAGAGQEGATSPKSHRGGKRRSATKEQIGSDGIGRLDA